MTDPISTIKPERAKVLGVIDLKNAYHARGDFFVTVPNDMSFEDVMRPVFWANHVQTFLKSPFARVEVLRADGTMDLTLRVVEVKPGMVKMRILHKYLDDSNLETAIAETAAAPAKVEADMALVMPAGYKHVHIPRGAQAGHAVQLLSNGTWLFKGLSTKAEAVAKAKAHKLEAETVIAA